MVTDKIGIVIPTVGRCDELRRMLKSLAGQTRQPHQVLIVGEGEENSKIPAEFPQLNMRFIHLPGSSISDARNRGTEEASPEVQLIAFMDDDIVLEPGALEAMLNFWAAAPDDMGGASCNHMNHPEVMAAGFKSSALVSWLGFYSPQKGAVLKSGTHTMIGCPSETIYVSWLPTYAVVYRRDVLADFSFDPWFKGYSYLEDLDFSYRISRNHKLAVVADSCFHHYPSNIGRTEPYKFGKKEVLNRVHFVAKHPELSRLRCGLALSLRCLVSIFLGLTKLEGSFFKRAAGNLAGFVSWLTRQPESVG
jgi:GT2 family glycosyltransferase